MSILKLTPIITKTQFIEIYEINYYVRPFLVPYCREYNWLLMS
jgi:hypothetical protein